jgi:hypothetical protein
VPLANPLFPRVLPLHRRGSGKACRVKCVLADNWRQDLNLSLTTPA